MRSKLDYLVSLMRQEFQYKLSFLRHQVRDLPACWANEREGRITEIAELKTEILDGIASLRSQIDDLEQEIQGELE